MKRIVLAFIFVLAASISWAEVAQLAIQTASGSVYVGTTASYPTAVPIVGTVTTNIASATFTASGSLDTRITSDTSILGFSQTTDVTVTGTSQLLASLSSRLFISIQNKAATESCYLNPGGTTATPGMGFEIKAGDTYERDDGPLIPYPIVCTTTASIAVGQER